MNNKPSTIAWTCTILLFALLMVGCQKQGAEPTVESPNHDIPRNQPVTNDEDKPVSETNNDVESKEKGKNDAHISSDQEEQDTNESNSQDMSENTDTTVETDADYEVAVSYTPSNPTLMGVTVNETKSKVIAKFGSPTEQYVMADDIDPITVYNYKDFIIGFNQQELVVFVDVTSNQVNPGLNGLRLENTVEQAITALGKPDSKTDYVMSYLSEEVVLKLDINPNTNQISSIKLFGRE